MVPTVTDERSVGRDEPKSSACVGRQPLGSMYRMLQTFAHRFRMYSSCLIVVWYCLPPAYLASAMVPTVTDERSVGRDLPKSSACVGRQPHE